MPVAVMAKRAFVGRQHHHPGRGGDPGVSHGIYATVLFLLGLHDRLATLADPATDELGLTLAVIEGQG